MKRVQLIYLLTLCLFLVGCTFIPAREIESLGIINARGVDKNEKDQIETSLALFQFEGQSKDISKVISGKSKTLKGAVEDAGLESNFNVTAEKIQLEIYGKETAKQGILPYIDTLNRDASVPDTMYLSISDTTAKKLLSVKQEKITIGIGQFLNGLIEENSTDHLFPRVTFQDFLSSFYDIGKDPFLPYFEIVNNVPKLTSIAIMQDDKYVGKIPADNKLFFNLTMKNVKDKRLELTLPMKPFKKHLKKEENISEQNENLHTAFNVLKGKGKTTLIDKDNLTFQTEIDLRLNLIEMSERVLIKDKPVIKRFEKEIEKEVASRYEKLLSQLQSLNSDAFGYGTIYRIKKAGGMLTRDEWREKFPKINVKFKVNANVITHGSVD